MKGLITPPPHAPLVQAARCITTWDAVFPPRVFSFPQSLSLLEFELPLCLSRFSLDASVHEPACCYN